MRPFDYENDDLDDIDFESIAASRHALKDRHHHHKSAGRKRHKAVHKQRWESEDLDSPFDSYDSYDDEFDSYYDTEFGN